MPRCRLCGLVGIGLLGAAIAVVPNARAQNRPFPQNIKYPHGFVTTKITSDQARTQYELWKNKYLKTDCGNGYYRVEFNSPTGTTVSEGMGYGMLLTAYFGDKTEFDGLWKFVQKNLNSNGVMGWKVNCSGFVGSDGGQGSATDGDLDIAFSLIAAVDQWGDAYRAPATKFLGAVKAQDFTSCSPSGRVVAKAGDWGGGCNGSNSSYWMPAYHHVFQKFSGDSFWNNVATDAYALFLANRNTTTGFTANEVDQNGATNGPAQVDYNGCRIPWRVAMDYLWNGTSQASNVDDKLTDWADAKGISTLVDGYQVDGTPTAGAQWTKSNPWTGGWAVGAMTKSQDRLDRFALNFKSCNADDDYYSTSLRSLYMLILTGNFWQPGSPIPAGTGGGTGAGGASPGGGSTGTGGNAAAAAAGGADSGATSNQASGCAVREPKSGLLAALSPLFALIVTARLRRRTRGLHRVTKK